MVEFLYASSLWHPHNLTRYPQVRLGNQDIDFSPSFACFLITRDPSVDFSADISSRVTFVNFSKLVGQTEKVVLIRAQP